MIIRGTAMADLIQRHHWGSTPLGPIEGWSDTLLTHVNFVLASPLPAALGWGDELILLYNDAAIPTLGRRQPPALGRKYREVFEQTWHHVQNDIEQCLSVGASTVRENLPTPTLSDGILQEAYWTYSVVPIIERGKIVGVHNVFQNTTAQVIATREQEVTASHLQQALEDLSRSNEQLSRVAGTDALTGLANRRAFDERYEEAWRTASAEQSTLSVVLVDLDHFKRVNDHYGHLYGDQALRRVAHLLSETLRKGEDFAARFGGEEVVLVLP
jgi:hypothetical protein